MTSVRFALPLAIALVLVAAPVYAAGTGEEEEEAETRPADDSDGPDDDEEPEVDPYDDPYDDSADALEGEGDGKGAGEGDGEVDGAGEGKGKGEGASTSDGASKGKKGIARIKEILEKYLKLSGYLQPQFRLTFRPDALPRDRLEVGFGSTRAGIILSGSPLNWLHYNIHLVVGAEILEVITDVDLVDRDGDGSPDDISPTMRLAPGLFIEELTISFTPTAWLRFAIGQMRIPFTAQHLSANTALMFPDRSGPNDLFLRGTDLGILGTVAPWDGRLMFSAGIFNGSGFATGFTNERGVLLSARLDVNPLGAFPFSEGDLERGPFRFGIGAGLLYAPSSVYDDTGFLSSRARDFRLSASLRMAARGFFLQAEFLRRQRTDSLSSRPDIATGVYGQASFFFPVHKRFGMSPLGRIGWTAEDQAFDTRVTLFIEAGVGFYVGARSIGPDALRIIVQYLGERRITEGENAHGAVLQLQLKF